MPLLDILPHSAYIPAMSRESMTITTNRAPVLTLWASIVAERQGFDRAAGLTLGKAVAGLNAQTKGRRLGIFRPPETPDV
jgi:hypothetical protein